jgi:hypothetical protein
MRLLRRGLRCGVRVAADDDDGFAQGAHALDQVGCPWRCRVPEHDEDVAGLRHLVITAHTSDLPKPLPVRPEELMLDRVLPGPALAE